MYDYFIIIMAREDHSEHSPQKEKSLKIRTHIHIVFNGPAVDYFILWFSSPVTSVRLMKIYMMHP